MKSKTKKQLLEKATRTKGGDIIIAEIGAGTTGVAVGKDITQDVSLSSPAPDDKTQIQTLFSQIKAHLQQTPNIETPETLHTDTNQIDLVGLHNFLRQYFNESELRDLCLSLAIDYEDLGGNNKTDKTRELVLHCYRHGQLLPLITALEQLRPFVNQR